MKSRLLDIRNTHHIEESQLDQMLSRHSDRAHNHISFLVSPPCHATNFMRMAKFELASTDLPLPSGHELTTQNQQFCGIVAYETARPNLVGATKLASTADEAQGSTSRTVAGEKGAGPVPAPEISPTYHTRRGGNSNGLHVTQGAEPESDRQLATSELAGQQVRNGCVAQMDMPRTDAVTGDGANASPGNSDFSILSRPHIVKKSEEVHLEFCFTDCGRVASGHCECGNAVCNAHRYDSNGNHNPYGMCSKCLDEITAVMDTGVEMVRNIGGRQ